MDQPPNIKRRTFLLHTGLVASAPVWPGLDSIFRAKAAPAAIISEAERPVLAQGIQIGDVLNDRAIIWSRSDRAARMLVEWDLDERFRHPRTVRGPHALEDSDFTARVDLRELPPGQEVFVRVRFAGLGNDRALSAPIYGRFRTP